MTRSPVDIIAAALCGPVDFCDLPNHHRRDAEAVLAALAGEGWELYRPGECESGTLDGATFADCPDGLMGLILIVPERPVTPDSRTYRLVPVEGENP